MPRPLDGIRVLDFSIVVQGPQCAAMLADLGADVVKIERRDYGDISRLIPISSSDGRSAYFYACNRGKRSLAMDITVPAGREAVLRLAEAADVMLTSFAPGVMDRLGLGYEVCAERNPRLIYATASGLGPLGPDGWRKGVDLAGQAVGGLLSTTGQDGEFPTPAGAVIADSAGGLTLCVGILAALFARGQTGRGQCVDASLLGGQVWTQASELTYHLLGGRKAGRANRGHPFLRGVYRVFKTSDGYLAIAGLSEEDWAPFTRLLGRSDLEHDPRFANGGLRSFNMEALNAILDEALLSRTTAEWCEAMRQADMRYAPVNDYEAVANYEQAYANGYLRRLEHPVYGPIAAVGNPVALSDTPAEPGDVAPELGQHTEEVLLEAGYTWDDIAGLRKAGAI